MWDDCEVIGSRSDPATVTSMVSTVALTRFACQGRKGEVKRDVESSSRKITEPVNRHSS